jgi:acetoin utilization deacetylase AcuC-like enzyme
MSRSAEEGLDWIQLACSTIRETVLAQPAIWQDPAAERGSLEDRFDLLMEVLEDLARSSEWLVLWDLQETLIALAAANLDLTLRHVRFWVEEGEGLQPIFGVQALLRLAATHPREVLELLVGVVRKPRFQEDFWLARTLVAAARSLGDQRHGSPLAQPDRERLRKIVEAYAVDSPVALIRGVALAALPFVSRSRDLAVVQERAKAETWSWALWNLAFGLQEWQPRPDDGEWLWDCLEILAHNASEHVRYAVDCTVAKLQSLIPEHRLKRIDLRLRGSRWLKRYPRPCSPRSARVGVIYSPAFLEPAYDNHVECRERIQVIVEKLESVGSDQFTWIEPRMATFDEVRWAHTEMSDRHRDRSPWPRYLEDVVESSRLRLVGDSAERLRSGPSELRFESCEAALLSAGGVLRGVDFVLGGEALAAFAINRPPGHLANNMICIFNNVAIAAHYARKVYGIERIFILDFDAHHGSHTYRVFRQDPAVIYFSIHQEGNYAAEAGLIDHTGIEEGEGFTFNMTYPSSMGDDGYACLVESLMEPVMREWKPGLILLSAGFDGHFGDPLTRGRLTESAYIHLAERIRAVALDLGIKVVATMEGGYGLEGMANSLVQMLRVFGDWPMTSEEIGFSKRPDGIELNRETGLASARESVRSRVELMAALKARRPDYPFDLDLPHWRAILADEPPGQG